MIGIHQSQFLPWIPYFYKITKADVFVVMDDVQYQKNGVQNRNMVKTSNGPVLLTVPVKFNLGDPINKTQIANKDAVVKMLKTFEMNYKKSSFYNEVYKLIEPVFMKDYESLNSFNIELINIILHLSGIKTKILFTSQMELSQKKDDLVIEIINKVGDKEYLSGKGAFDYMDMNKFKDNGISIYTYSFNYAEYPQLWTKQQGFVKDLSMIDLLFNALDISGKYISDNGSMEKVI